MNYLKWFLICSGIMFWLSVAYIAFMILVMSYQDWRHDRKAQADLESAIDRQFGGEVMGWVPVTATEYRDLYRQQDDLGVLSSATFLAGKVFSADYIITTWGKEGLPYIKSLKDHRGWQYWKWEGPPPEEEDGET